MPEKQRRKSRPHPISSDQRLGAPPLPPAGKGWGEGEAPHGGARPSSGRFATTFSRKREKGRRIWEKGRRQRLGAPPLPLAGEGWGEGSSSSPMGAALFSMTHLAGGVAPVAADGVAAVMPALGLAESASGPRDSILRPMESVFGWASGRSGALTI
jgi:hypothetical protein